MNNNIVGMETNMEQLLDKVFDASLFSYPCGSTSFWKNMREELISENLFEIVVDNVCTI